MSEPIVYQFRACELRIWPDSRCVETVFPDGAVAGATRECEMNNLEFATRIGYPDCFTALVCHEATHTFVSERLGHLYSPTLYAVAAEYGPGTAPYEERLAEEAVVIQIERFVNTGEPGWALLHPAVRPYVGRWAYELRKLREHLLSELPEAA